MESRGVRINRVVLLLLLGWMSTLGRADDDTQRYPMLMPDVQPTVPESYLCTAFAMPKFDSQFIVGFTPNASPLTAHHIAIYGCDVPGEPQEQNSPRLVWDCGDMTGHQSGYIRGPVCESGSQVIYVWAKDAPPLKLPEGVAFRVGKDTGINYLVLQVHYAHVEKFLRGDTDNSGVVLSLLPSSNRKVDKTAGVYKLKMGSGVIRAREEEDFEVACRINEPVVLHPFAFRTHTHALGKMVSLFKIGKTGRWRAIGEHDPQEPQMFYPVEDKNLTIEDGDIVAARCTMFNFRQKDTYIGKGVEDEMCISYMMYWVDGDRTLEEKYCISNGHSGVLSNSLDATASQLM